ncbi:MAG TPA: ARMT1-like domain-containing protein [Aggregatilineaceae bacterium]|nr:ARMT1-like domain-containing protein [Aggregatilineaceae bacterium]
MRDSGFHRPDPIRVGGDNAFATDTMAVRVPGIIREVQSMNADYPDAILRRLDRLHAALTGNEPIQMLELLPAPGPDYEDWQAAYREQRRKIDPLTWQNCEWFFAETFLYRHLIQAVRWAETGRDPFAQKKREELESARFLKLLNAALEVDGTFAEKLPVLLSFCLWGNRVDLSHPAGDIAADALNEDEFLVDDREALRRYVTTGTGERGAGERIVHIIADNAGTELAMDLILADLLLAGGCCKAVVFHVKPFPTYVSDATVADVWNVIRAMENSGDSPAHLAARLRCAWDDERLRIATHYFWTSSRFLWEMPSTLSRLFRVASLVILKGDMNYRRAVGDALWDVQPAFSTVMQYFPAPVVALRSLKSDAVVGLSAELVRRLDQNNAQWRVGGHYGVIQFATSTR